MRNRDTAVNARVEQASVNIACPTCGTYQPPPGKPTTETIYEMGWNIDAVIKNNGRAVNCIRCRQVLNIPHDVEPAPTWG